MLQGNCSLSPFPNLDALSVIHHPMPSELLKGTKQREILLQGRSLSTHNCPSLCPEMLPGQRCIWALSPTQEPKCQPRLCVQKGEGSTPCSWKSHQEQRLIHFPPPSIAQSRQIPLDPPARNHPRGSVPISALTAARTHPSLP